MANLNIKFNNKSYSIPSNSLAPAIAALEAHLTSMMEERLEGDGQEFHTLAPSTLSFRSSAPLNELKGVQIDGVTVDPANYTLEEGSTIVTFPIDYLKNFGKGNYEVTVESENKSVSGEFSVVDPDLNEHGFYYNQPYTGYAAENSKIVFFIRDDGTLSLIDLAYGEIIECTYVLDGNNTTITSPMGVFTGTITSDGFYCNELAQRFVLGDSSAAADNDYIYIYKEELGGYEVTAINKRKPLYGAIKTGINGFETVALSDEAFFRNENLMAIPHIPDSVKSIGNSAFQSCCSITSLDIPNSVISIEESAFDSCEALKKLIIPDSVTTIGSCAFRRCLLLEEIVIGNSVTSLDNDVFMECPFEHLRRIVIGNSVVGTISGFRNSKKLKEVIIGNSVSAIGDQAFEGCTSLADVEFGDNCQLGSIDRSAFEGCVNLKNITIPDSVTSIGGSAFCGCTGFTSIVIPDSVETIGEYAFADCSNLSEITLGESLRAIGSSAFQDCASLTSIVIPDSVASIGDWAFYKCTGLTSIVIGDSVTSIGYEAFRGCTGLTSIEIPNSVTSISDWAFSGCTGLESIGFEGTTTQWDAITKGTDWNSNVPATVVHCSDDDVTL